MNVPKIAIYGFGDILTQGLWSALWPLLLISLIGTYLGKQFMRFVSESWFERIALAAFSLSAVALLFEK